MPSRSTSASRWFFSQSSFATGASWTSSDESTRDTDAGLRIRFNDRLGDVVGEFGARPAAKRDEDGVGIGIGIGIGLGLVRLKPDR
jgi:hypothetical protein